MWRINRAGTDRRGLALVGILLMLTVLGMLAVLMTSLGSQNQRLARAQTESEVALNAAEAGLAIALESYIRDSNYTGNAEAQPFGGIGQTYQVSLHGEENPPSDGTVVPPDHMLILATGRSRSGASRQVAVMVTQQLETETHSNALLAGEKVWVSGQAQIATATESAAILVSAASKSASSTGTKSSKTSGTLTVGKFTLAFSFGGGAPLSLSLATAEPEAEEGLFLKRSAAKAAPAPEETASEAVYAEPEPEFTVELSSAAAGTSSSDGTSNAHIAVAGDGNDALTLEAGAVVDGELRIPPGADEADVVNDNGSFHNGVNAHNPPTLVPVRLPLVPGDQDINWTPSSSPSSFGNIFNGNELAPGAYGDVVVDGGVLELNTQALGSGDKDLYIFRSLTLKNGGQVVLKGEAEGNDVVSGLYIDEKFEVVDGSLVNQTNDPSRLQVYVTDGAPVNLDLQDDQEAAVMLYAPGSVVNMDEGELRGSIVGEEVYLNDGAVVNYVSSLAGVQPDPWGNGGFYALKKSYRRR